MQSNAAKHGKLSKVFAAIWLETAGACSSVLRHASFLSDPEQRSKKPASSSAKRSESSAPSYVETFTIIEAVSRCG